MAQRYECQGWALQWRAAGTSGTASVKVRARLAQTGLVGDPGDEERPRAGTDHAPDGPIQVPDEAGFPLDGYPIATSDGDAMASSKIMHRDPKKPHGLGRRADRDKQGPDVDHHGLFTPE